VSDALSQCEQFLSAIFEPTDMIEFRTLKPVFKDWSTTAGLSAVVVKLQSLNGQGAQVYFGANPRKRSGESKESGVALSRCLFADFDGGVTVEEAWSRIKTAGLPMPTVTIVTGGGVHCWWRLDEPVTDAKLWSKLQKQLAQALGSDPSVHDWPRIMRLPGFVNQKYEHKPLAELVDADASRVYSLTELKPATPGMSDATRAFVERGVLSEGYGRRETMFAAACDLRDRGWTPEAAEAVLMPRMRQFDLPAEELADCPRQIHNAWTRPPRPVSGTTATSSPARSSPIEAYKPFPVDALPEPLSSFVAETAAAIGCDPAYVALPLVVAAGAAIGTTRRLELKYKYEAPAILWSVIVGESGTSKSPALRSVLEHVRDRERRLREEYAVERREYEATVEAYEKERAGWRSDKKSTGQPPERPAEPVGRRALVSDTTVEALALKLADNPRGLLLARDELAGWLNSLDRYANKSGSGSDESFYLSCYNAEPHTVDRRTGDRREINVAQAGLWIVGGIQPQILQLALGTTRRQSGLLSRLLLVAPPPLTAKWSEREVSPLTRRACHDVLDRLYELEPDADGEGRQESRLVRLTADGKKAYVEWHDRHVEEALEKSDDEKAAWSKFRETVARLALVFHEVRLAAGDAVDPDFVDVASVDRAIRLVEWQKHETRRVYRLLAESAEDRVVRQADERLTAFVAGQGGTVAVRDVIAGVRWVKDAETAESALQRLVDAGRGDWIAKSATDAGGRPTRLFVLKPEDVSAQPPKKAEIRGSADADACQRAEVEVADEEEIEV